jgi:hypothetical protein
MTRTIFVEFAVDVAADSDLLEIVRGMKVAISGNNVDRWELAQVCDDDGPIISNFLK